MRNPHAIQPTLAVIVLTLLAACNSSEQQSRQAESPRPSPVVAQKSPDTAEKIGDKAKEIGDKVAEGAKDAGASIKKEAEKVGADVGAAKQTLDVKTALMADKNIDASNIDVDTDAATKTVTLKGTVPSAAQKAAAEKLAHKHAEGYHIKNQLTVAAKK
jgi:osmotically-inducible protein OsmY